MIWIRERETNFKKIVESEVAPNQKILITQKPKNSNRTKPKQTRKLKWPPTHLCRGGT